MKLLSIVLGLVAASQIGVALYERQRYEYSSVESRPYNEATKTAVDLQLEQAQTLYQICAGFLVTLWGLIIGKKDEKHIGLGDAPRRTMFVASSALLVASLIWSVFFLNAITAAYAVAGATVGGDTVRTIPDVFDMKLQHLFIFQRQFVVTGGVAAVFTLIAAYQAATNR